MVTIMSNDGNRITSINDWFAYAPPAKGALHWKDGRSAKELAKAWFRTGKAEIPAELAALLQSHPVTRHFRMKIGIPEKETILDDFKGSGRNHDLVLIGETPDDRVLVAVEAKTDEPFGEIIGDYIRSRVKANPRSRVPDRIQQLARGVFGHTEVSTLRYQLLHAAAGTLIEAKNQHASHAVLVIHEFVPSTGKTELAKQNEQDLAAFLERLSNGGQQLTAGALCGPFHVPGGGRIPSDIPLYIGKIETDM
ncbi:hypothetical protein G3578_08055 [Brevibacillus sp. SYP-B805]|uniref:DUF6946 family protein n=1 Tax=Brevibacillus sp. SYP-B805 TaxID=1578199 RepID=UPI0013ECE2DF|nr:hypothetical protein [Brevibacillus sp. SYP-B805]NGQ95118.1 hypothetical protein [Brevibacillus sp. SYP-B805]